MTLPTAQRIRLALENAIVDGRSVTELLERFEVMAELEVFCARLTARCANDDHHARVLQCLADCELAAGAGDSDRYYSENTRFHQAIYRAAHNDFLLAEARRLQAILQPYRRRQLQAQGRVRRSLTEHRLIAARITVGDAEGTARATADLVLVQGDRFHDLVARARAPARSLVTPRPEPHKLIDTRSDRGKLCPTNGNVNNRDLGTSVRATGHDTDASPHHCG